jgi:isoquinoline 1-oxidoreductase beta subunit
MSAMDSQFQSGRRRFIGGAAAGAFMVAMPWPRQSFAAEAGREAEFATAWLRIGADNKVTVITPTAEVGQGTSTGHCQIVADELGANWNDIGFELAPVADVYKNPLFGMQATGASVGLWSFMPILRNAAAAARTNLVAAAARQWGVEPGSCIARNGEVVHAASGRSVTFGAVAADAARLPLPQGPILKDPKDFTLMGRPVPRLDIPAKTRGEAIYAIDFKMPGMLYAAVMACPVFGGKVVRVDDKAARAMPGVRAVLPIPAGVAVVAEHFWQAQTALQKLDVTWDFGPNATLDSSELRKTFRSALKRRGAELAPKGDVDAALKGAYKVLTATYEWPFLAHATMEPMTANASYRDGKCDAWVGTQRPDLFRDELAKVLGLAPQDVTVHNLYAGGGFGRRQHTDSVIQAALLSKALQTPVKVIWTRAEDMQHGHYRPAGAAYVRGALDKKGKLIAFENRIATGSPQKVQYAATMTDGIDIASTASAVPPYEIPNRRIVYNLTEVAVPIGMWRSVGASHNAFVVETFVDELAAAAGTDPLEFRRAMLAAQSRERKVLDLVAAKAGWGRPLPKGHFQGIALDHKPRASIVGMVAEISLSAKDELIVHRLVCVADPGQVVNPNACMAQFQGAIIWGLAAALYGEISVKGGRVAQSNFHDYRMVTLADVPSIEVEIHLSGADHEGTGESTAGAVAPSMANAIFAATGKRLRALPLSLSRRGGV